jgi:hypothetical protein
MPLPLDHFVKQLEDIGILSTDTLQGFAPGRTGTGTGIDSTDILENVRPTSGALHLSGLAVAQVRHDIDYLAVKHEKANRK